mmetsp:Transcript_16871/g.17078  ORF Transcript_16871/g.17078 Transcript_16871/m.17078 type:complete len:231 (-) Transcript_16871:158-850(-)
MRSPNSSANFDNSGDIIWHGPHHVANTSSNSGVPAAPPNSVNKISSEISFTIPGSNAPLRLKSEANSSASSSSATNPSFSKIPPHRIFRAPRRRWSSFPRNFWSSALVASRSKGCFGVAFKGLDSAISVVISENEKERSPSGSGQQTGGSSGGVHTGGVSSSSGVHLAASASFAAASRISIKQDRRASISLPITPKLLSSVSTSLSVISNGSTGCESVFSHLSPDDNHVV